MSDPSNGITFRVIQEMMPDYHLAPDLLEAVVAALPPPPASATTAWRHARLTRIIEEVAARVPMDAAQGHLAGQIAMVQFLADDFATRIHTPGLDLGQMCRLTRTTDALLHTVARMERVLERRQFRVMPFRDVKAVDGFDLAALDQTWCSTPLQQPATGPRPGGDAWQRYAGHRDEAVPGPDRDVPDAKPAPPTNPNPGQFGQARPVLAPPPGDTTQPGRLPTTRSTAREEAHTAQPETSKPAHQQTSPPTHPETRKPTLPETIPLTAAETSSPTPPETSNPTSAPHHPNRSSDTTARRGPDAVPTYGAPAGSVVTRLEEGPGWTLDVIRRATATGVVTNKAVPGATPGAAPEAAPGSAA
jgi:hypothetical protein